MALHPCPECSKQCSDAAVACPHCGFPLQEKARENQMAIDAVLTAANDFLEMRDSDVPKSVVIGSLSKSHGDRSVTTFLQGLVEVVYNSGNLEREVLMPLVREQAVAKFSSK